MQYRVLTMYGVRRCVKKGYPLRRNNPYNFIITNTKFRVHTFMFPYHHIGIGHFLH